MNDIDVKKIIKDILDATFQPQFQKAGFRAQLVEVGNLKGTPTVLIAVYGPESLDIMLNDLRKSWEWAFRQRLKMFNLTVEVVRKEWNNALDK